MKDRLAARALELPRDSHDVGSAWAGRGAPSVARLFESQVGRTPDSVAIAFGRDRLSYRELDARANRLARRLRHLGVAPGVLVGICMERSVEAAVAVLGVLKTGSAYVALDPEYPRERLELMMQDSRAPVILSDTRTAGGIPGREATILALDSDAVRGALASRDDAPLDVGAGPEDLAYVIYTSGSTGTPKGVAMPHRALVNLVQWQVRAARNPAAKTLQFASLNFDVSFQEMFSTWCAGGTLVLISEDVRRDPTALWQLICSESVERVFLPFVALQHLAEAAEREASDAPDLREVITAGEQLQITPQIARFFSGDSRLLQNQYGPSETHVATSFSLLGPPRLWPALPPIGHPIANIRVYVLDPNRRPLPAESAGELWIGGIGVARGYWNRPELTAEKFVPDPFGGEPAARLYRTGDLARYRPDGEIEFLGRLDHQVKIRGYRVEPGEISAALSQHPAVRESVVVPRKDESGSKSLVAYVVVRPGHPPRSFELRAFLRGKLPEYMVPSMFVDMASLPLTPSGKVDRKALPAPGPERPELEKPFVAPRDTDELRLAKIWEKILRIEPIGVHDDFFELGGHSLVAGRLFAEIQKSFGRNLPPTTLLAAPTVERMAPLLKRGYETSRWTSLVPIQPGGSRPPLFCMHAGAGTILFYYELARELGPDQPLYGLQARGLYGGVPPHAEIGEMVSHYLSEIRTVQPHGPYFLAGFCFGGLLAFATAERLREEGQEVGLLATFDGGSHRFDYALRTGLESADAPTATQTARAWTSHHITRLKRLTPRERISYLARKAMNRSGMWLQRIRAETDLRLGDVYRALGSPLPERLRQTYFRTASVRAARRYSPRPYPGRMVIFESQDLSRDRTLGWHEIITGGLEIHELPVHPTSPDRYHAAFIPAVAVPLIQVLRTAQDRARRPSPSSASA